MSAEEAKALVRKWFDAVDTGDAGVVDRYVSTSYRDHNPPPFPGSSHDFDAAKSNFAYALQAFSDFRHEVEQQIAEGDLVVTRVTGFGRHTGDFLGIAPTGKDVQMSGIAIHRVADGKIVEHWAQIDALGLLAQLGVVDLPAPV